MRKSPPDLQDLSPSNTNERVNTSRREEHSRYANINELQHEIDEFQEDLDEVLRQITATEKPSATGSPYHQILDDEEYGPETSHQLIDNRQFMYD